METCQKPIWSSSELLSSHPRQPQTRIGSMLRPNSKSSPGLCSSLPFPFSHFLSRKLGFPKSQKLGFSMSSILTRTAARLRSTTLYHHRRFLCSLSTESRTQKLDRIASELLNLNKIERHDYNILFRLKLGLNRYGPAVSSAGAASDSAASASNAAESKAEKTAYDIKLEKFDAAAKIKIIKEVRTFTDLGLKEAKELVEKAPVVLKKGITKEEATAIAEKLKELGATVALE